MCDLNLKYPLRLFLTENFSYFFKGELVYLKGHEKTLPITIQSQLHQQTHFGFYTPALVTQDMRVYGCFVSQHKHRHQHRPAHRLVNSVYTKQHLEKKLRLKTMQNCLLCGIINTCVVIRLQRSLNQMQQHFMKRVSISMYIVYNWCHLK